MKLTLTLEGTKEELIKALSLLPGGILETTGQTELPFPVESLRVVQPSNEEGSPSSVEISLEEVKTAFKKLTAARSLDVAKSIMLKFGPSPSSIPTEMYGEVIEACQKAMA